MLNIYATETNISIIYLEGNVRGTIGADLIPHEGGVAWWIARAIVSPPDNRGKGIGSQMMAAFKEAVLKSSCKKCIVAPGGYGANRRAQFNFYLRNGFTKVTKELLEFTI